MNQIYKYDEYSGYKINIQKTNIITRFLTQEKPVVSPFRKIS